MAPSKGVVVTVPVLLLSVAALAVFLFFLIPSLSSCSCPATITTAATSSATTTTTATATATSDSNRGFQRSTNRNSPTAEDILWVKDQIKQNKLQMQQNILRKGINPRTRAKQLEDLYQFKGISHYEGDEANNHTAFPCPGELLVEEHHSNYGEPWAGGRDVFEFLAESIQLRPDALVLEIGCGTLRVGLHFITYLVPEHYHCLERDELSLMAAFRKC